jgi:hypothetical protein
MPKRHPKCQNAVARDTSRKTTLVRLPSDGPWPKGDEQSGARFMAHEIGTNLRVIQQMLTSFTMTMQP